jgi:hypothetical protein
MLSLKGYLINFGEELIVELDVHLYVNDSVSRVQNVLKEKCGQI